MAKDRRTTEWEWYATRSGVSYPPKATLADMQKIYWSKILNVDTTRMTATDCQYNWLGTYSGVTAKNLRDRWAQAITAIGKTPVNDLEENKYIFYTFAP